MFFQSTFTNIPTEITNFFQSFRERFHLDRKKKQPSTLSAILTTKCYTGNHISDEKYLQNAWNCKL